MGANVLGSDISPGRAATWWWKRRSVYQKKQVLRERNVATAIVSEKLRKAALVVASLDEASAARLLEQLPASHAVKLRQALQQLTDVDPHEQTQVIREFLESRTANRIEPPVKIELSNTKVPPAVPNSPKEVDSPAGKPFRFLDEVEASALAGLLRHHYPQIAAVVLAHVTPEHAAAVLEQLPGEQQTDVLRRIAEMENAEPEAVQELEKELCVRLSGAVRGPRRAGLTAVGKILEAADRAGRNDLRARLLAADQRLAKRLASLAPFESRTPRDDSGLGNSADQAAGSAMRADVPVPKTDAPEASFDDVLALDEAQLAQLLALSDPQVVLVALVGAEPSFIDRIKRHLPHREARRLDRQLKELHPLRLSDVEWAQQQLAHLARKILQHEPIPMNATGKLTNSNRA